MFKIKWFTVSIVSCFLFLGISSYAQKVIYIDADYILKQHDFKYHGRLSFIKGDSVFDVGDDRNFMDDNGINLYKTKFSKYNSEKNTGDVIPVSELKKIEIELLLQKIKQYQFTGIYKREDRQSEINLQLYNENLFIRGLYKRSTKPYDTNFFCFYFIIVNNSSPIIILYNCSYDRTNHTKGYIIPWENEYEAYYNRVSLKKTEKRDDIYGENLLTKTDITDLGPEHFYKIKSVNDTYILKENRKARNYFFEPQEIKEKNIQAYTYYEFNHSLQIIQNNQVFWINKLGNKTTSPKLVFPVFSGFDIPIFEKIIYIKENRFYYIEKSDKDADFDYERIDTTELFLPNNTADVTFYNKTKNAYFYDKDTTVSQIRFILKDKNNKYSLAVKESLKGKKGITVKKKFIVDVDKIEFINYHHPLKFYKSGLCGYYPQNKEAKYKTLERFNYYFARFELPNGKKGWLGRDGKEYLDK